MPKQLIISAAVDLPDDVFAASEIVRKCGEPWQTMLAGLKEAGVKHTHSSETIDVRAKVERAKRGPYKTRANGTTTAAAEPDAPAP